MKWLNEINSIYTLQKKMSEFDDVASETIQNVIEKI